MQRIAVYLLILIFFASSAVALMKLLALGPFRKYQTRSSDRRKLSPHERRTYKAAVDLIKQNKHVAAAQCFESIGMMREAIATLEKGHFIREAAGILLKMQRPNRAGAIYARHKRWQDAAQCFKLAEMPLEAAKCLYQAGQYQEAGEAFEKVGSIDRACYCYERAGNQQKAEALKAKEAPHWENPTEAAPMPEDSVAAQMFSLASVDNASVSAASNDSNATQILDPRSIMSEQGSGEDPELMFNFHQSELVADLTDEQKQNIWNFGISRTFNDQQVILDFDETPEGAYIVLSGRVSLHMRDHKADQVVQEVGPGSIIGEFWLLADVEPELKFVASGPVTVLLIKKRAFLKLLAIDGHLATAIYRRFSRHLLQQIVGAPRANSSKIAS